MHGTLLCTFARYGTDQREYHFPSTTLPGISILLGFKGGINVWQVNVCAYVIGQFVILLIFEIGIIESSGGCLGQSFCQFVEDDVIVQNSVEVTTPASFV